MQTQGSAPVPPDDVSDESGGNKGPWCPGLCERQGTGVPGSARLTKGCPWRAL